MCEAVDWRLMRPERARRPLAAGVNRKLRLNAHVYWPGRTSCASFQAMQAADLARENALMKARFVEVKATLIETQEAHRWLQDILSAAEREKFNPAHSFAQTLAGIPDLTHPAEIPDCRGISAAPWRIDTS